jgi:hypothetical protein
MAVRSEAAGLARVWPRLEAFAATRAALPTLFILALAVYALESVAVPLHAGRDFGGYLRYYVHFFELDPVVEIWSLTRGPVASFASVAPLDIGGAWRAEIWMAVLFAGSIVCWAAAAAAFGPRAAIFTAVALLLYPAYGILFHALGSDSIAAAAFAPWALLVVRATDRPSVSRFAAAGLGVALLTLVRPVNQVLLVFALFALIVAVPFRRRLAYAGVFFAAAAVPLLAWSAHNSLRYGDFAVVRGANGAIFSRVWLHRMVSPENGPASRELAEAVEEHLLGLEPYRSYDVSRDEFFSSGSFRMLTDVFALSDRHWGWGSDYEIMRKAAWEAVSAHPGEFARQVGGTAGRELRLTLYAPAPAGDDGSRSSASRPEFVTIRGRKLPKPTEGQPIPSSHYSGHVQSPDGDITEVWTSATEHHIVFEDPRDQIRYEELNREVDDLGAKLPGRNGSSWLVRWLDRASRWFPRPIVWLALALVALAVRRPRRLAAPLAIAIAALLVLVATALVVDAVAEYVVPVAPAFVLLAAVALLGPKRNDKLAFRRPQSLSRGG